jgi:hypothetical protein
MVVKRKKRSRVFAILLASLLVTLTVSTTVMAQEGYTYTYDFWGDYQYSPDAYQSNGVFTAAEFGLEGTFMNAESLYAHGNLIYLCDSANNRIVILEYVKDQGLFLQEVITQFKGKTEILTFLNPTDLCIDPLGNIYICDKGNERVLKLDSDWNYIMSFTKPTDPNFDQDNPFSPSRLVADVEGRVFVVADKINKGLVKFEADGSFSGFMGATPVTFNMLDYIWKRISTAAQRAQMESFVPTEYDSVYMDSDGFIYACTTKIEDDTPLREMNSITRLNMLGSDILIKNGEYPPVGDVQFDSYGGYVGPSEIIDVMALDEGVYFGLDRMRGRLFAYDEQGKLLFAFGGSANVDGYFKSPVAMDHIGRDIFVLDKLDSSITILTTTEYGDLIFKALAEYQAGDYITSGQTWREVLHYNGNYDLAYIGIGRAYLREEKYKEAMEYFKLAYDDDNYSRAFQQYRKEWVEEHIGWIFAAVFLLFLVPLGISKLRMIKWRIDTAEIFTETDTP